ncbi:hypothetical protein EZS27_022804 [termite gut metagenome]|uniref:Uncharacterized protein n=1 Tax=termite gut metagenome TaxID=433724 RepID=A0A5J4R430_9ZZZZ
MKIELTRELKIKLLQSLKAGYIETSDYPEFDCPEFEKFNSLEGKSADELKCIILGGEIQSFDGKPQQLREKISILQELDKEMMANSGNLGHIYTDEDKLLEYIRRIEAYPKHGGSNIHDNENDTDKRM